MTSQHAIHSLWLFLVVLGYMLLLWLLWFLCQILQGGILLCYPPFDGSWMGSSGADVHVMWSLSVPANRENIYQNGTSLPCFHYVNDV